MKSERTIVRLIWDMKNPDKRKFTAKDLEENRRAYTDNFNKLLAAYGTKDHMKYVKIERVLCKRNMTIMKDLGLLS